MPKLTQISQSATRPVGMSVSFAGEYHTHDAAPGPAPSDTA